jgi:hypothetical protein
MTNYGADFINVSFAAANSAALSGVMPFPREAGASACYMRVIELR